MLTFMDGPLISNKDMTQLWEFIKFTVQTLNAQLSERFTDHQRVMFSHLHANKLCQILI